MKVELNIGLNNNPYDYDAVVSMITGSDAKFSIEQYQGNEEPTAVMRFYTSMTKHDVEMYVRMLADMMTQECIAILMDDTDGMLVYNPSYEGEKYEFSIDFFRRYDDVEESKVYYYCDRDAWGQRTGTYSKVRLRDSEIEYNKQGTKIWKAYYLYENESDVISACLN
jgi:hypothetical protein